MFQGEFSDTRVMADEKSYVLVAERDGPGSVTPKLPVPIILLGR